MDAAALPGFVAGLDASWAGLSLTMPLKAAVLPLLDRASDLVRAVGAANTVVLGPAGRSGENTDVPGMVGALRERGISDVTRGCVLGGGATAAAALAAMAELGESEPTVVVRDPARAAALLEAAGRLGATPRIRPWRDAAEVVAGADVVVATTPARATDELAAALPGPLTGLLLDVVYAPWPTDLARAWREQGGEVAGGLDLLVHQAVLQVGLMTGLGTDVPALVPVLRRAGEAALRER